MEIVITVVEEPSLPPAVAARVDAKRQRVEVLMPHGMTFKQKCAALASVLRHQAETS
ncbi:hypothetical protein KGQ19_18330 [Catenulispora sp. NL8]|uniref:Uncharacterized protein n=1 Tax=Catenulispora pinistramenti TaxID=2705254 RepID=A0ABS5KS02_9ACTN|nr:hypothetical protein [Catenulispora pinistramenti]MBS2548827.1 hypothetical protein [Catenulispora pinistramenti]